jgi:hypothetical protein
MSEPQPTKGAAAQPLSRRVIHLVDERIRSDQPVVALTEVVTIAKHMHARDAATTDPDEAVKIALRNGDLMLVRSPHDGRRYLGPVDTRTARWSLGEGATPTDARQMAQAEAEGHARRALVGVWNTLAAELAA